jgi:CheY-like chemotaxis protein
VPLPKRGRALDAAVRGAELTSSLLAFARRQPLRPERTDVNSLVGRTVNLLKRTLGEDIVVSFSPGADLWPIVADPAQLEAALTNLATNARDAMPRGGRLMVATSNRHLDADYAATHFEVQAGDYAMIEVSDTGTGIPPEALTRIFEPFFTTKEEGKGTGLGLSMVFGFMKQSGGHINVYSEERAGTTFRLYLPRAGGDAVTKIRQPTSASIVGGNETLLVVEDNAAMRRIVVRQLKQFGYAVMEAESAQAALDLLATEKIDLLFTDVVMPGDVNGIELARTALARLPALKVILTSGFPEIKLNGTEQSMMGMRLLSKPYRKEDIAKAVREVLDS